MLVVCSQDQKCMSLLLVQPDTLLTRGPLETRSRYESDRGEDREHEVEALEWI